MSLVVSVPEQRLYVFNAEGQEITRYSISTSKFGTGSSYGSYSTPLGQLEVASKHGSGALEGTVFKSCARTGEICKINARGRDPIVTRIMWLRGLESQNANAYGRRIYIHGTPDEAHIGRKASYGCIRMKSRDIIALYETVEPGMRVEITNDRVGSFFSKATRPQAVIAVAEAPTKTKAAPGEKKTEVASGKSSSKKSKAEVAAAEPVISTKAGLAKTDEPKASNHATASAEGKTRTLSLDEPLIGAPEKESKEHGTKKKGVVAVNSGKKRS
jgi:hypothetical protein